MVMMMASARSMSIDRSSSAFVLFHVFFSSSSFQLAEETMDGLVDGLLLVTYCH